MAHVCNFDNQITFTFPQFIFPSGSTPYTFYVNNPTGRQQTIPPGFQYVADTVSGAPYGGEGVRVSSNLFAKLLQTYRIYFEGITVEAWTLIEAVGDTVRIGIQRQNYFDYTENENAPQKIINIPFGTSIQKLDPTASLSYYNKVRIKDKGFFDYETFLINEYWLRNSASQQVLYAATTFHNLRYKAYK